MSGIDPRRTVRRGKKPLGWPEKAVHREISDLFLIEREVFGKVYNDMNEFDAKESRLF
jgi:hypothetical protein